MMARKPDSSIVKEFVELCGGEEKVVVSKYRATCRIGFGEYAVLEDNGNNAIISHEIIHIGSDMKAFFRAVDEARAAYWQVINRIRLED